MHGLRLRYGATPLVTAHITHVLAGLSLLEQNLCLMLFKERVWPYNSSVCCTYHWVQPSLIKTGESSGSPHSPQGWEEIPHNDQFQS